MPPSVSPDAPNYARDAEDLQVLSCRRTTLEWVLRRCALAEPNVRFEVGVGVAGLLIVEVRWPGRSTSRGVRLDDGTEHARRCRRRQHRPPGRRARVVRRPRR